MVIISFRTSMFIASGISKFNLKQPQLSSQLKLYEDDFKKERLEKEQLITQKERLKRELSDSKATVAGLQRQLKQVDTIN